jgi:hypothetical protein
MSDPAGLANSILRSKLTCRDTSSGGRALTRALALSPHGHVYLTDAPAEPAATGEDLPAGIAAAFARDPAGGLLQLGGTDLSTALSPTVAYWRGLAR